MRGFFIKSNVIRVPRMLQVLDSFFFFQAEDGIRDDLVTGVQTCALPILGSIARSPVLGSMTNQSSGAWSARSAATLTRNGASHRPMTWSRRARSAASAGRDRESVV